MEKKKFAIISISSDNLTNTIVHNAEMVREWIHGCSNGLDRLITPLVYLEDGPDNPVEESTLDISYHIEFQEFIGEMIEDDPKTLKIGDSTVLLSKAILNNACIATGVEPGLVTNNEYKLWYNDRGVFIEATYRGSKHSPHHNPTLTLIYDGVIKQSIFTKALLGDDND